MVDAELSTDASVLMTAPASAAKRNPRTPVGTSSRTSVGYAWSGVASCAPYSWCATRPGITMPNGTSSHSAAANTIPSCACLSDSAPSARCTMNWLSPQ